ncbi:hypothetical protein DQ04_04711070 [Trypanosoma grayi]|uniref:hypothetical protein n=1 Tax=Trypanosoma grayi TaxID=71804 RepID=UPI0004F4B98A|nr:hypothetical protein DQ04_04711070 [Trypanosoma grayi]KEG09754.1 hypothetical protein DQ04_04711070 [Trypanosoma grayi]
MGEGGGPVMSAGSIGFTALLASFAVVLSAVTYISNKRRTSETYTPNHHPSLRGLRPSDERQPLQSSAAAAAAAGGGGGGGASTMSGNNNTAAKDAAAHAGYKSYYAVRAERHVSRHSANAIEWRDDVMGVRMLFSPILFAVETEQRQAPLVLVGLRYLRQPEHHVAVIFEECPTAETAEEYRDNSLARIRDCAKLLSCSSTRIGSASHPCAEYCYVDAGNRLRYVLSVFLTNARLAVTAQYVADTRVKGVLPTAFNELVRSIQFAPSRSTPSYLLCTEPRLGLGFRLPIDFAMDDELHERMMACDDPATTATAAAGGGGGGGGGVGEEARGCYYSSNYGRSGNTTSVPALPSFGRPLGLRSLRLPQDGAGDHNSSINFSRSGSTSGHGASAPFAALTGNGLRRMVVVACYEPLARGRVSWQALFEHQLRATLMRFAVVQKAPLTVAWCAEVPPRELYDKRGTFVVRPQKLTVPVSGDGAVDDDDGDASETLLLDGAFCVQEVVLDPNSPCAPFLRDMRQQQHQRSEKAESDEVEPGDEAGAVAAYLSLFCLRIRDECVSFSFLSSITRHTLEEFITFCRRTLDTVSVGNHFGQNTSLIYCNVRHEVLPFHILLDPVRAAAAAAAPIAPVVVVVEEPPIGDPLAVIHIGGLERVSVLLRVFPCPTAPLASPQSRRRSTTRLEKMVQNYLSLLPDRVNVLHWESTTFGARVALELHYEQVYDDNASDAESVALDEEVGNINPFAHYRGTPPLLLPSPPLPPPVAVTTAAAAGGGGGGGGEAAAAAPVSSSSMPPSPEPLLMLRRSSSCESREDVASLHVAVAVCCEGCAFLFLGTTSAYNLSTVREVVRQLAANVSVVGNSIV